MRLAAIRTLDDPNWCMSSLPATLRFALLGLILLAAWTISFRSPGAAGAVAADAPAAIASVRRVALVIGNGAYEHAPHLRNPPADARSMESKLRELGFDTSLALDVNKLQLERALHDFVRRLGHSEVAVLFYAGHGLQVGGRNYFVPIDARLDSESDVPYEAADVQRMLESMQSEAKIGILFLDSCRDNPLANRMARSVRGGSGRGLTRMEADRGEMLIVYATSPDRTAEDGQGEHSPFTTALLRHIGARGVEVQSMLKRVIRDVESLTVGTQIPWQSSSLRSDVYLGETQGAVPSSVAAVESPHSAPVPAKAQEEPTLQPGFVTVEINSPRLRPGAMGRPSLLTLVGEGANGLWVGGSSGELLHFDGQSWVESSLPGEEGVLRLVRVAPAELWMLTTGGLFRQDARRWLQIQKFNTPFEYRHSIWGSHSRDLWLVGTAISHWDGKRMRKQPIKDVLVAGGLHPPIVGSLNDIWGSSAADIWAVGEFANVLHYDGKRWSWIDAGLISFANAQVVWGAGPREVWMGGRADNNNGFLLHYDGVRWSPVPLPALSTVKAISGTSASDVWILDKVIRHFDGKSWSMFATGTSAPLSALWVRGPGDVWAAGDGTLVHYHAAATP